MSGPPSDELPRYPGRASAPRDLRTAEELAENGYETLGPPRAVVESRTGEPVLLYSTSEARKLRYGLWPGAAPSGAPLSAPADAAGAGRSRSSERIGAGSGWLTRLFSGEGFVVLDTETTGLGARAEIIEVAAVDSSGEVLLESRVWPRAGRVPVSSTRVHGLTTADLMGAPTWPVVLLRLERRLAGRRVLAWNAPFDQRMALQSSALWDVPPKLPTFECAMRGYAAHRRLPGGRIGLERAALRERLLSGEQLHRSLADARLTLALLRKLHAGDEPGRGGRAG